MSNEKTVTGGDKNITADPWEAIYEERLAARLDELKWLYMELYDNAERFRELCENLRGYFRERNTDLKESDRVREARPGWYRSSELLGMMLYIDSFAGNIRGVEKRLDYLERCNVNYIHLMPFLDTPKGASDGGYAVADFRKVRSDLGTMEDLEQLTADCHGRGINVCMDFVMNHTSREHVWARRARAGEEEYRSRYFFYPDRQIPDQYERTVPQVFPTAAPGNFTWLEKEQTWVMTTFYPYQWDLNYRNPKVFNEMMGEFLFLANRGIDIMRLDAVPYIWKEPGTTCRNLPQVHSLVRMMRIIAEIVCPGVLLLGEVVMEPEKVVPYFGTVEKPECHMLYNVTTMATTWHTVATRNVKLLRHQLGLVNSLPKEYVFLNYLRCHDDIGWGLDYEKLREDGMEEYTHKKYLNDYFQGYRGDSVSRGELYNDDPVTGDARFCGTTASMCGIEKAGFEGSTVSVRSARKDDPEDGAESVHSGEEVGFAADATPMDLAVRKDLMLHAYLLMQTGIPVLYSGDEVGQVNDYSYRDDPEKADDSRYIHRGRMDWELVKRIDYPDTVQSRLFPGLDHLETIRRKEKAFSFEAEVRTIDTWDESVLCMERCLGKEKILGLFNFSEQDRTAWINETDGMYENLLTGEIGEAKGVNIPACGYCYLKRIG
ncbi:MAG: alpha-amylase family protein [Clostridiales bacterium]|nr:alpha-amylase family protein [Clostridiales bacterium]